MASVDAKQQRVLDVVADEHVRSGRDASGKRIRHALSDLPRGDVKTVLATLVPRYLDRILFGESDTYYLTLEGWLQSHQATLATKMLEDTVRMLRSMFDADPDFREFTWEDVKAAANWSDESFHFANMLLRAAHLWGNGGSSPGNPPKEPPKFNYSQPYDIEEVIECATIDDIVRRAVRRARAAAGYDAPMAESPPDSEWDVFISHATEDKKTFVEELAAALQAQGLRVWYDTQTLKVGDSLHRKIDEGLAHSRFGVVVLSKAFFNKHWPQRELDGLVQREGRGDKVILPIWHGVDHDDVMNFSVTLADKVAISSARGIDEVVRELLDVVRSAAAQPVPQTVATPKAPAAPVRKIRANFQGSASLRKGHELELSSWIGPGGSSGGTMRVLEMRDLTDDITYESDVARMTMTVQPTRVPLRVRVAGDISHQSGVVTFTLELTEKEYARFEPHMNPTPSALVR